MVVWCNTDRFNSAYATYHGRFGKTIGEWPSINCDLYDWTALIGECILCFAYTFRDIKTTDGIFNMGESYFNKINRKGCIKKVFYMLEVLLEVKICQIISFIP